MYKKEELMSKENMRAVITLWASKDIAIIAKQLKLTATQVSLIATYLRREGVKLPHKHRGTTLGATIREIIAAIPPVNRPEYSPKKKTYAKRKYKQRQPKPEEVKLDEATTAEGIQNWPTIHIPVNHA